MKKLYIPHGSDERVSVNKGKWDKSNFISHMVQMKVLKQDLELEEILSLYPTWFR